MAKGKLQMANSELLVVRLLCCVNLWGGVETVRS